MLRPTDLNIYLTSKCNHRCHGCRRSRVAINNTPDVTPELLQEFLDRFGTIKTAAIAGFGEPLLSDNLGGVLSLLEKRNVRVGLITNGSMLCSNLHLLADAKIDYLSVSLNFGNAQEHELYTGVHTFFDIVKGIMLVQDIVKGRYKVGISKVCFRDDYTTIPAFIRLASYMNVDFVYLTNNVPYRLEDINMPLTKDDLEVWAYLQAIKQMSVSKIVKKWPLPVSEAGVCTAPMKSIGLDGSGYITGCRRILPPDRKFGHFSDVNVWETNKELNELRAATAGYTNEYSKFCDHCFGRKSKVAKAVR